jgi:hypothetical protein
MTELVVKIVRGRHPYSVISLAIRENQRETWSAQMQVVKHDLALFAQPPCTVRAS